ncbi:isopentenyl-diphosphate Delta-isomerase [Anaerosporobacter sp.]
MKDSFSIFIFDANRKLLMQQKSINQYPSGGLWANTCCSYPLENEPIEKAVHRRLEDEFGFDCKLDKLSEFCYQVYSGNGGYEYEFNHVYIGFYNGTPEPNEDEIMSWKWMNVLELLDELRYNPENYSYWFRQIYRDVLDKVSRKQKNRILGL